MRLIHERGEATLQSGILCHVVLQVGRFGCSHWTPFREIGSDEALSPGYRHAIERQHRRADLPYGLTIRGGEATLLTMMWNGEGAAEILAFHRGGWEAEILTLR